MSPAKRCSDRQVSPQINIYSTFSLLRTTQQALYEQIYIGVNYSSILEVSSSRVERWTYPLASIEGQQNKSNIIILKMPIGKMGGVVS